MLTLTLKPQIRDVRGDRYNIIIYDVSDRLSHREFVALVLYKNS